MKFILLPLIILLAFVAGYAIDVNIIMKDGTVIKGDMLGKTSDEVYLEQTNGQSLTLKISDIKSAFDAKTGEQIDLTAAASSSSSESVSSASGASSAPAVTDTVTNTVIVQEEQSPDIVVIPNTYVYYYNYGGYDCFYYGGYWWRPWGGFWYRSPAYYGGWVIVDPAFVPYNVMYLPPRWRVNIYEAPRVPWFEVRDHWREWDRVHYWNEHGWRRDSYVRPAVRPVRPEVRQQVQRANTGRVEKDKERKKDQ